MKLERLEMYHNLALNTESEKSYYVVYARKSTEDEDKQISSIEDQLKEAEKIRLAKNLPILEVFTESKSAKKPGRPEFNRMIELIDTRKDIRGIICWKVNRLSRNPQDEGMVRQLLSDGRITEIITPEKKYTQIDSDFIMAIEGAQAQRFISDLRKDTARGVQSKLDRGIAPQLAPPGYRNAIEKRQGERDILHHPVQFALMRKVFDYFLTGNYSVQQLWHKAKGLGVKSNRGKILSRTQLYKCLKDPFYTGTRYVYAGRLYTNGVHKPMITDEEFDFVQDILSRKSHPRGHINTDLLTGLISCGECGRSITSEVKTKHYKNGKSQTFIYYRCTKKWQGKKCLQHYMRAEELEKQVMEYLGSIKLSPRFVEWGIKWLKVMHDNQQVAKEARLKATQKEYNEVDRKIGKLVDLMISGIVTTKEGAVKKQQLEAEKTRLFNILSRIDVAANEWTNLAIQTFDFVKTAQEKFENGSIETRKTILKVLGSNLILKDRKLDITIRTPFEYIQKVVLEIKGKTIRLEPVNMPAISSKEAVLGSINSVLGGRRVLPPRPPGPQPGVLLLNYIHQIQGNYSIN